MARGGEQEEEELEGAIFSTLIFLEFLFFLSMFLIYLIRLF